VLIADDDAALVALNQLRALGVHIALDDFGTGYSSLSYLQRFPFDKIKIDRSFVKDLGGTGSPAIIKAVVSIAADRNMITTAEGVETTEQRDMVQSLGCTQMQGYLFSAARPAHEIRAMLTSGTAVVEEAA
jgi:EAL domain-containing protein (putative c-di-GMP-specific phosphodiesterase class I)